MKRNEMLLLDSQEDIIVVANWRLCVTNVMRIVDLIMDAVAEHA